MSTLQSEISREDRAENKYFEVTLQFPPPPPPPVLQLLFSENNQRLAERIREECVCVSVEREHGTVQDGEVGVRKVET